MWVTVIRLKNKVFLGGGKYTPNELMKQKGGDKLSIIIYYE